MRLRVYVSGRRCEGSAVTMQLARLLFPLCLATSLAPAACASDEVLLDTGADSECGNGKLEPGEACDVESDGCQGCVVVPNWSCDASGCTQLCGDGVLANGGSCDAPKRDTDCDLTGYWAARETDYTRDSVLGSIQTSSTWYLYRLEQTGDDFRIVEEIECGTHVTGSAVVDSTPGTLRGLIYANRQDAVSPHGARHGTSKKASGGCAVTLDRRYKIRGVTDAYLPIDFASNPALADLPPLPSVTNAVTSTEIPEGSVDTDGDGIPGVAYAITGFVNGTRNAAQRDWKEFATPAGKTVPAASLVLSIPGAFDLQENVLRVTGCAGGCALIGSAAHAASDLHGRLSLAFIGKTFGSDRVARVVAGKPRESLPADLTTCANVRLVLPHDGSTP
jgi:hypothetical protein